MGGEGKEESRKEVTNLTIAKPFLIVPSATALHISITPPQLNLAQIADSGLT